jgi:hypothetical protein
MLNKRNLIGLSLATVAGRFLSGSMILMLCLLFCSRATLFAQKADDMKFVGVDELMLIGQGFSESHVKYGRLPANMEKEFRPALRNLGANSAGLAVRFSSNSKAIAVKWTVRGNNTMNHMASTRCQRA